MYLQATTPHILYMAGRRPKYDFGCDGYGADLRNGKCRAPITTLPQHYHVREPVFMG